MEVIAKLITFLTTLCVTRHLPHPCFSQNLMVFPLEYGPYIPKTLLHSRWIIFDVLRPIWSRYFNVTDTFCQFYGVYGISDLESRLEVIWGRRFLHQSKAGIWLLFGSLFGPILLRFRDIRDIRASLRLKPLFRYSSPIPVKIPGCSLAVDPWRYSLQRTNTPD